MATTTLTLPSGFVPQILDTMKIFFKIFSPIITPIIGVGMFLLVIKLIFSRFSQSAAQPGVTGWLASVARRKKLIMLLSSAIGAFTTWLALQPAEFRQGFMLPFELFTGLVLSDKALYALATALFSIAAAVFFL